MSLGENSLVAAYQGRGQLKSRPSGTRVVTDLFSNSQKSYFLHQNSRMTFCLVIYTKYFIKPHFCKVYLFLQSHHFGKCILVIFLSFIPYNNISWIPTTPHNPTPKSGGRVTPNSLPQD